MRAFQLSSCSGDAYAKPYPGRSTREISVERLYQSIVRVSPGRAETGAMKQSARVFISVDLPTLLRPAMVVSKQRAIARCHRTYEGDFRRDPIRGKGLWGCSGALPLHAMSGKLNTESIDDSPARKSGAHCGLGSQAFRFRPVIRN